MNTMNRHDTVSHMPALDGLRGVAILLVALSHFAIVFSPALPAERIIRTVLSFGWCGVDLFFVLSGFLITGILLETRHSEGYFLKFYMRRVLRIFPLYFAFLGFVFLLVPAVLKPNPVAGVTAAWYLSYLQNWKPNYGASDPFLGHFWSLAVEEQFYLVWPAIVLLVHRVALVRLCSVLAVAGLICRILLTSAGADVEAIYRATPCTIDSLVLGALVALAVRDEQLKEWVARACRYTLIISAACVAAIAAAAGPLWQSPLQHTAGMTALAVLFATVVFSVSAGAAGAGHRLLTYGPLRSIGKYSYGIYVFHMLPNRIVYQAVGNSLAGRPVILAILAKAVYVVAMFVLVYLLAFLSYRLFESRFLALKQYFSYRASRGSRAARLIETQETLEGATP
jgi:peptidoglycan/LPS O-acetylase OafA/YrhL